LPSIRDADLLLILGTSLKVFPFAALANYVNPRCPRVLINLEEAGDVGERENDVLLLGQCDDIVRMLAKGLGWEEELEKEWEATKLPGMDENGQISVGDVARKVATAVNKKVEGGGEENRVKDEVEKLSEDVGKALKISDKRTDDLLSQEESRHSGDAGETRTGDAVVEADSKAEGSNTQEETDSDVKL
jgi:NAD-dependent histone deacetylase SIR2